MIAAGGAATVETLEAEIDPADTALRGKGVGAGTFRNRVLQKIQTPDSMSAKARLFTQILPGLKEKSAYFTHKSIQAAVNESEVQIGDAVLNVYLTQATK